MSRHASGVEFAARWGYAAKGIVYATIGILAAMTAFGFNGGRIVGTRSAIETLRTQPFGQALLWAIGLGLLGFVIWRFTQTFLDPENRGNDAKGLIARLGLAASGLTYGALAVSTLGLLVGRTGASSSAGGSRESAATIMQYPLGIWMVGLVGAVLVGVGGYQAYRAYSTPFRKHWRTSEMSAEALRWSTRLSSFGIAARAVAFALMGWFFIQAARRADPNEAQGLDGALRSFTDEPYGTAWLALIGLGFFCYGVYCGINARYKRIPA